MKVLRFRCENEIKYGVLEEDTIYEITGSVFGDFQLGSKKYYISEVTLLSPVSPTKVVCVGKNYKEHALEMGEDISEEPVIFLKPPTAVVNPGDAIVYPEMSKRVDYEGELVAVIKSVCKNIQPANVPNYILGYTCGNDVTARDLQKRDGQWTRGKSFDTFCPLGPWIETDVSPECLKLRTYLNGELKQDSSTALMITPVFELISFVSRIMTLLPGDVVMTGTPAGIGPMDRGDVVEVQIEGIGSLKNYVI
ncbi:MAG: hypothetical protein PWQ97_237 [Tepidanaerobacteraceae bacterium]|nr:hypothetical protein [Tepidanaerobacteraceae bacterium]